MFFFQDRVSPLCLWIETINNHWTFLPVHVYEASTMRSTLVSQTPKSTRITLVNHKNAACGTACKIRPAWSLTTTSLRILGAWAMHPVCHWNPRATFWPYSFMILILCWFRHSLLVASKSVHWSSIFGLFIPGKHRVPVSVAVTSPSNTLSCPNNYRTHFRAAHFSFKCSPQFEWISIIDIMIYTRMAIKYWLVMAGIYRQFPRYGGIFVSTSK